LWKFFKNTTVVNQGNHNNDDLKSPGEKIKLLETPKIYSTKQFL